MLTCHFRHWFGYWQAQLSAILLIHYWSLDYIIRLSENLITEEFLQPTQLEKGARLLKSTSSCQSQTSLRVAEWRTICCPAIYTKGTIKLKKKHFYRQSEPCSWRFVATPQLRSIRLHLLHTHGGVKTSAELCPACGIHFYLLDLPCAALARASWESCTLQLVSFLLCTGKDCSIPSFPFQVLHVYSDKWAGHIAK